MKPELAEILYANVSVARARPVDDGGGGETKHSISSQVISIELQRERQRKTPPVFVCRSSGSKPGARLEWFWLAPEDAAGQTAATRQRPMETLGAPVEIRRTGSEASELVFVAGLSAAHNQLTLACRATNNQLARDRPGRSLVAAVRLDIKFEPQLELVAERPAGRGSKVVTLEAAAEAQSFVAQLKLNCHVQVS